MPSTRAVLLVAVAAAIAGAAASLWFQPRLAQHLATTDAGQIALDAVLKAGRDTVVNLWATWCAPCLKEMPELDAFARDQAPNGTQVAGIALDDAAAVRAFLRDHGIAYPSLVDTPGPADAGVRLGNPAGVLPYSLLVSADGRILKTRIGPFADKAEIEAWARR